MRPSRRGPMRPSPRRASLTLPLGVLLAVLACVPAARAAENPVVTVERLSDRVLVANTPIIGRANVTAIATRKGLVLVDAAASPYLAGQLKQALEKQLGRTDWVCVINTHVHDHTGGNGLFKNLPIIGHENAVEDSKAVAEVLASEEKKATAVRGVRTQVQEVQKKLDGGAADADALRAQIGFWQALERDLVQGFEVVVPNVRFTDELTLDMGDLTIHALYLGQGHSAADVLVHVPEEKLVVAGSACGPMFPRVGDKIALADLQRSVAVLDKVLKAGIERVVPSHAEPGGREIAERRRDYYRDLLAGVTAARGQGLTLEKAQAELGLEQRFPYMRGTRVFQGTPEQAHAANVAAVWKLVQ